jgi:hypothetical protein
MLELNYSCVFNAYPSSTGSQGVLPVSMWWPVEQLALSL